MEREKFVQIQLIVTTQIPGSENSELTWLMLYVCLAYHYKFIFCGLLGGVFGLDL
ncbi:MAG: hypothetical protein ACI85Q_002059 [Salibacteraceae bacterium]|jgi:hypothetical protein